MINHIHYGVSALSACHTFALQNPLFAAAGGFLILTCAYVVAKKVAAFTLGFFSAATLSFYGALKTHSLHHLRHEQMLSLSVLSGLVFGLYAACH